MTPQRVIPVDQLTTLVGQRIGESGWVRVDQNAIDTFASLTRDRNWIHVDPQRAADTPYGTTIAHGFFVLALMGGLLQEIFRVQAPMALNYGVNKTRFPQAVPQGSKLRLVVELSELAETGPDCVDAYFRCVMEVAGTSKPACVADIILRYYRDSPVAAQAGP